MVTKQVLNIATTGNSGNKKAITNPDENESVTEKTNVETVAKETKSNEEFKGINYTGLISVLTEAIKEQQVLIEGLKKQNKLLTKRINKIENKLK